MGEWTAIHSLTLAATRRLEVICGTGDLFVIYFWVAAAGEVRVSRTAVWARSDEEADAGKAASAVVMRALVAAGIVPAQRTRFR